jgi:AcrR family transcriptional regulator
MMSIVNNKVSWLTEIFPRLKLAKLNDQSNLPGRATRDRIIEAARELFYAQGYTATGIAQILKASGSKSGSLYHFFPSKEDLLVAVLENYKLMLGPHVVDPSFDRVADPIERVFALLDGYRQLLMEREFQLGCPIGDLALEVGASQPRARRLIAENFDGWCEAVEQQVLAAAGRMPTDVDPKGLARFVLASMEGAVMLARSYGSLEPFDQVIDQLRDHFDRLIKEGSDWSRNPTSEEVKGEAS